MIHIKMPAQLLTFLIAVFQLFCLGNTELAVAHGNDRAHITAPQHHIVFHNISGEEAPEYTLGFEEAEDTDEDSNEALKHILAAAVLRRVFLPVSSHEYNAAGSCPAFYKQTPLFVLHQNFRV
ncbi:MAG: hypothetical protein JNL13_10180 [Chitinophagaceae bacterium]|nr:hypothetical protein [Chitinophagaceae bacterium]